MKIFGSLRLAICALIALGFSGPVSAQDADPCAEPAACRFLEMWVYEDPDGETHEIEIGYDLPWVTQGNILIIPGETVVVRLEEIGGLLEPVLVRAASGEDDAPLAPGEISFHFAEYTRGNIMLTVLSNHSEPLEYAALKVDPRSGPDRTSVCTLLPGVSVFESWREPIFQLALWGFRPAGEGYSCSIIELDGGEPQEVEGETRPDPKKRAD